MTGCPFALQAVRHMARMGYGEGMRIALLSVAALALIACQPSDPGGIVIIIDPLVVDVVGTGPQLVACARSSCCAIIGEAVACSSNDGNLGGAPAGLGWVGLESADRYLCAWRADGLRECWGDEEHTGPLTLAHSDEPIRDMRFGTAGGIEIMLDGSLGLWGSDFYGQISGAPDMSGEYIAIEAGLGWFAAVSIGGQLEVWGIEEGEGPEATAHSQVTQAPPGMLRFQGLDYGTGDVLCGVTTTSELVCWGGGEEYRGPLQGLGVQGVAPSANYTCAHLPSGLLACAGELIPSFEVGPDDTLAPPSAPVVDVACGHRMCCAIPEDAVEPESLVCWGEGWAPQGIDAS